MPGEALEGGRADELQGRGSGHHAHLVAVLHESGDDLRRFERSDRSGDDKQDPGLWHTLEASAQRGNCQHDEGPATVFLPRGMAVHLLRL